MIPKSISASSLLVSEACMRRWRDENLYKTPQVASAPADVGSSCHYALEHFVNDVYLEKKYGWDNVAQLNSYYQLGYVEVFGSTNFDTPEFADGAQMVARWYDRFKNGLPNTVLSVEKKETFPVKTSIGEIPFTYIYDRLDQIDEDTIEVVDYKTYRAPLKPEDLKRKIQPRAYALAAQIKFPKATRIWVTFDMLRYDTISAVFTRDENAATYRYIKRAAERIIATDEEDVEERLNDECKWCIVKTSCETLAKANAVGTIHGMSLEEIAQRRMEIADQILALKYADDALDAALVKEAEQRNEIEFNVGDYEVNITSRATRKPNSNAITRIIGPELTAKYGNMTMTNIDKMLKSGELTPDQERQVKGYVSTSWSSPSAKVKKKSEF